MTGVFIVRVVCGRWSAVAVIVVAAGLWAGAANGCPLIGDSAGLCGLSAKLFWCGRVSGCRPLAQCGFGAEPSDAARQGLRRLPLLGDRYGSPRCVAVSRRRVPPRRPRAGQRRCNSASRCAPSPGRPVPAAGAVS